MGKNTDIHAMNKFLKGIHMGTITFKEYLEKSQAHKLQDELIKIIDSFKRHEEIVTKTINDLGGDAAGSVGIIGGMGQFFEKVKLLSAESDEEILNYAIKAMEMGIKNSNKFIEENSDLDEELMEKVRAVVQDYNNHLRKLQELW